MAKKDDVICERSHKEKIFYSYTRKHFLFYLGGNPSFYPIPKFLVFFWGKLLHIARPFARSM